MRRSFPLPIAALVVFVGCSDMQGPLAPEDATLGVSSAPPVTVMTRNLYLGANIDLLLDPTIPLN